MTVVTRFAPSPTGFLHIGGARTALFNWLYAKRHNGKFLLRIEDTDLARSTPEATDAILDGLKWLGLDWDGEAVSQFSRVDRHREAVESLLATGNAYKCYSSPEELEAMREEAKQVGRPVAYDGTWRDRDPSEAPADRDPVIRLKTPLEGETVIKDHVQGEVVIPNGQIDDFVLLRADGTPTYMLAVVVDDHDMGVTHVIRGDDHLNNAARQNALYAAMGWTIPEYAHIPLIHGPDGAKLSKRHGALGVEAYRDMGYLPAALRNYLARLGWSHGDDEIFSDAQAQEWFGLDGIGKAPARFDFDILSNLNAHYIKEADDSFLVNAVLPLLETAIAPEELKERLEVSMPALKERAQTLPKLAEECAYLSVSRPLIFTDKALKPLDENGIEILRKVSHILSEITWEHEALESALKSFVETEDLKMGKVFQPLRSALTGGLPSPGVYDILLGLGRNESLNRINDKTM